LNRIALTRPHLQYHRAAEEWLADHVDAPALPAGLDQQLADARAAVATAKATHDGAQRALTVASTAADGIERDAAATEFAERLDQLAGMLGEAEKTAKDIVERRAEHAAKLEDVQAALRDIGATGSERHAADVIPTVGLMAEARAAITKEAGLRKALELARERLTKAKADQTTAETAPAAVMALPDGLVALLGEIRADRNPLQHAAEAAERGRVTAAEVTRTLALVPSWANTAEALRALALPSEAAFERVDAARRAALALDEQARRHRAGLTEQNAAARKSLSAMREQPLPDADSIATARAERDRGMRLVLRHAFGVPPTAVEDGAYANGEPVALVYERYVRSADDLADRRTAELERVQEAERLSRLLAELNGPLQDAKADELRAAGELAAAERAWADAVAPLGLDPAATVSELRKALAGRLQLIDAMNKAEVAAGAKTALAKVHEGWAVRLATLLGVPPEPLGGLLSRADERVAKVRAAESASVKRQAALEAAERGLRDAADALAKADRALAEWHEGWTGLLDRLHRPAGESPDALAAVLNGIAALDQHHRDAMSLERRIDAMQADLDRFKNDVDELAQALGEVAAATPAETARALIARATAAARYESAWLQAQLGLEQARGAATEGESGLEDAKIKLAAVIAACGATTSEDAEGRIAASRAHAEQTARRDAALNALAEHGDGLSIEALQAEIDAVPADDMAVRRDAMEGAVQAARAAAEDAAVKLDQLTTALDIEAGATAAVDARADYEAAAAEFSRRLEEQLVLDLASTMLGDAMRSVEEDMGGSSLARLSQTFAAVTGGAYGLETRDGAHGEELHAVEHAYPQESKSLDDLSEGTRDQLYLALRMVALRDHCAAAPALPFIADDILQTFDDARASATLRALSDLSNELQVIVLTHHAHLGSLAAELGDRHVQVISL
jgi:hypothetical protein